MPARLKRKSQGFVFMYNLNRVYTQNIILQVQMRHEIEIMNVKKTEWYSRLEITRMDEQLNSYTGLFTKNDAKALTLLFLNKTEFFNLCKYPLDIYFPCGY